MGFMAGVLAACPSPAAAQLNRFGEAATVDGFDARLAQYRRLRREESRQVALGTAAQPEGRADGLLEEEVGGALIDTCGGSAALGVLP